VTIPQGVEGIKQFAFENCTSLESVNIPDGLLSIGSYAFAGCNSLRKVVIPNSVTVIGSNAFSSCSALESLSIPFVGTSPDATGIQSHIAILFGVKTVTKYDNYLYSVYDSKNYSYTYYTYSLPSSLKNISITGPYKIPKMALQRCYNITNISISNEVASIGSDAFRGCESLTDIVFPVSITNVPTGAFYGADNLKNVYYTGTEEQWEIIEFDNNGTYPLTSYATRYFYSENEPTSEGNFWHYVDGVPTVWPEYVAPTYSEGLAFTSNGDGTCYVSGIGTCTDTDIMIPSEYNGMTVTGIGYYAFSSDVMNENVLTSITIPSSIIRIDEGAFRYQYNLLSAIFEDPEGWSHTQYVDGDYYECSHFDSNAISDPAQAAELLSDGMHASCIWSKN